MLNWIALVTVDRENAGMFGPIASDTGLQGSAGMSPRARHMFDSHLRELMREGTAEKAALADGAGLANPEDVKDRNYREAYWASQKPKGPGGGY